ncbi:hypothetical protein H4R19_004724, partial [Coemansia spiralis]
DGAPPRGAKGRISRAEMVARGQERDSHEVTRRDAVRRVLREKESPKDAAASTLDLPQTRSLLASGFVSQLQPLTMDMRPIRSLDASTNGHGADPDPGPPESGGGPAAPTSETGAPGPDLHPAAGDGSSSEPAPRADFVDKAFDPAVRTDILNSVVAALVRRSHILLYAEDAWSEGYSMDLLASAAAQVGALHVPLDIPDWSLMTSHIDPILEDLTIVSHPYSPPPDLSTSTRDEGGSMSFFANINRSRSGDEDDAVAEQESLAEEDEADGEAKHDAEDQEAYAERRADGVRSRLASGKVAAGRSSARTEPTEDDGGDPVLSREMMSNPLNGDATMRLDRVLDDFVSTPKSVGGKERPRIIVVKHLGDLLNTQIGYTLFARLVAAAARHNCNSDVLPVVITGLMHPSLFHPETPPPGIPPFDVNPATPVALMPRNDRLTAAGRGIGDILEGFLGGNGQRAAAGNVGVQLVQMDGTALGHRVPRVQGSPAPAGNEVEELPLFARIGIPPPARAVLQALCNMESPMRAASDDAAGKRALVGSLRQAMVAEQCMERNARVIRNICLLYQIPGLELDRTEADYLRRMAGDAELEAVDCEGGGLAFHRQPLYGESGAPIRSRQGPQRRGGWYIDHRPLVAMLQSLSDDVARRYFFAETFLHRWISLAQALAVRESTSLEAIRHNPLLLTEAGRAAVLTSRHLRAAWTQVLEAFVAMRRGMIAYQPESTGGDAATESTVDAGHAVATEEAQQGAAQAASISPLHRQVDFDEVGVGHRVEDIMDVETEAAKPKGAAAAAAAAGAEVAGNADGSAQAVRWADIAHQLEPPEPGYAAGTDSDGTGRAAPVAPPQKRIQQAKKNLTEYEQRLMGSVVDPLSIPTGFGHVCVREETVTTLQEIITLPILRPEYYSKGVLRRYGVSGILLFGPPGTGKTML